MTEKDPFDQGGESVPSLSFKDTPVGTAYTGVVVEAPQIVQARDFETGELAWWDDAKSQPKQTIVTKLSVDGEERSLWAPFYPSNMKDAVNAARIAAGVERVEVGGTLTVTYVGDKPNEKNPRLNPAKLYAAVYVPPGDAFAATAAADVPAAVGSIVARPASVPEAVWATLSAEQRAALAAVQQ